MGSSLWAVFYSNLIQRHSKIILTHHILIQPASMLKILMLCASKITYLIKLIKTVILVC